MPIGNQLKLVKRMPLRLKSRPDSKTQWQKNKVIIWQKIILKIAKYQVALRRTLSSIKIENIPGEQFVLLVMPKFENMDIASKYTRTLD